MATRAQELERHACGLRPGDQERRAPGAQAGEDGTPIRGDASRHPANASTERGRSGSAAKRLSARRLRSGCGSVLARRRVLSNIVSELEAATHCSSDAELSTTAGSGTWQRSLAMLDIERVGLGSVPTREVAEPILGLGPAGLVRYRADPPRRRRAR